MKEPILIISLDFEMFWGMAENSDVNKLADSMAKVRYVVPELLRLFKKYNIHATWATVGGIMASNDDEFCEYLPEPYAKQNGKILEKLGILDKNQEKCPRNILYAPDLVEMIKSTPYQEIGTHTYSHYYCWEDSFSIRELDNELKAANSISKKFNIHNESIVFPRNQITQEGLSVLRDNGIKYYRGTEKGFPRWAKNHIPLLGTIIWWLDFYLPFGGGNSSNIDCLGDGIINVIQSRFFKPYNQRFYYLEKLKVRRIKREMLAAAKRKEAYHLFWHPHNIANNVENNLSQLEEIFEYYRTLKLFYGMESKCFNELM